MSTFCKLEDLITESDVEQKLVLPILTSASPLGLGYSKSDFKTKADLRKLLIDKGAQKKLYYPDYAIIIQGIPALIIEAKKPGEDLEEALREARLYALELNSNFGTNINPCQRLIVTDGNKILSSSWDSASPDISVKFDEINLSSQSYTDFVKKHSKSEISISCSKIFEKIRGKRKFSRPTSLLGGVLVRQEEFSENGFGQNLAFEHRHIFNPLTYEERKNIVKVAYVSSRKRKGHVDPISKIIRAARPPSMTDAKQLTDPKNPEEIYRPFENKKKLQKALLLLIGNVGSGKSTFVDYLKEVALPSKIKNETTWITIDLNDAPLSKEIIYKWIQERIIEELKEFHPEIDFDELDALKKLYGVELNRTEKGPASYFEKDSQKHREIMADKLLELQKDQDLTTKAYVRFLCAQRGKLLVVVLDNCDKRKREEQLLMFDVAKWIMNQYSCLVFLPIRDTTYDHHKSEPPLDTVIKDLVFRIDPPKLSDVLYSRVKFAIAEGSENEHLSYSLPNGMAVRYKRSEQKVYLACILKSLFEVDGFFKQLVNGIAGRDIRKGIEIFLDFCKSGHINENEILQLRSSGGKYTLPGSLITRVLLRGNRKYYSDDSSHIKNLFSSSPEEDTIPDPFVRIAILQWLKNRCLKEGPNNIKGYHRVGALLNSLIPLGHSETRIIKELGALIRSRCILTESLEDESIEVASGKTEGILGASIVSDDDLISIAPAGHVHLQLLANLDYLASCSEDVWYEDITIAQKIADRLTDKKGRVHLSLFSNINNASDLVNYLISYKQKIISNPNIYLENNSFEDLVNIDQSLKTIESTRKTSKIPDIEKSKLDFPPKTIIEGHVVSVQPYGVFVEFGDNAVGMLHIKYMVSIGNVQQPKYKIGDSLNVQIIEFNEEHQRFDLKLPDVKKG